MYFYYRFFCSISLFLQGRCISIFFKKKKDASGAYSGLRTTDLSVSIIVFKQLLVIW